jgi:hypothetical protein
MWLLLARACLFGSAVAAPMEPAAAPMEPAAAPMEPAAAPMEPAALPALRVVDAPGAPGGWSVVDVSGRALTTAQVATALGDSELLARLRAERRVTWVQDGLLGGASLGMGVAGVLELVAAGPGVGVGARPDPTDYTDQAEWIDEVSAWGTRLGRSDRRDEHVWTGVALLTGAAFGAALVPLTGQEAHARARHPALGYERAGLEGRLGGPTPVPAVAIGPGAVRLTWTLP